MPRNTKNMERPQIIIPFTVTDKIVEAIGVVALLSFWTMLIINYPKLPDIIPIHYNAAGEVDNFGHKISLFILPIIASVVFIGFSYLSKIPHTFNYMVEINTENARKQYTIATQMLRYLKLSITGVFFLIFHQTVQIVDGKTEFPRPYFLMLTMAMIFSPIVYFFIQSVRSK